MMKPEAGVKAARSEGPPRQGPRPLGLHLSLAASTWVSSRAALPLSKNGSLPWSPALGEAGAGLNASLAKADPDGLGQALDREIRRRSAALLTGIETYRRHPYRRRLVDPPPLWSEGTTKLRDYGRLGQGSATGQRGKARRGKGRRGRVGRGKSGADGLPLLVVPSLINRAYILDLAEDTSLLRWLAEAGFRPFLVDWDRPGAEERGFTLTDYICGRLDSALDVILEECGRPPVVLGYCMGGLLALALALRRQDDLAGLALLATPWDFHAVDAARAGTLGRSAVGFAPLFEVLGEMPVDLIQALFASLDPLMAARKFAAFARLDGANPKADRFVALEDWLNDGVPLAAAVARECLGGWYGENSPAKGRWRVAGRPVDPGLLRLATLVLVPGQDRIVAPASAAALAAAIPGAETLVPKIGHIGMVVGSGARALVWQPLLTWLSARAESLR